MQIKDIKRFYQSLQKSIVLAKKMQEKVNELHQVSLTMNGEKTMLLNEQVNILLRELALLHQYREKISRKYKIVEENFTLFLIKKMPQAYQKKVLIKANELKKLITSCRAQVNEHTEMLIKQKEIVESSIKDIGLQIKA